MNTAPLLNENNPNHGVSSEGLMNLSIIRDRKGAYATGGVAPMSSGHIASTRRARLLLRGSEERVTIPPKAFGHTR